jgi:hypothetical protein
VKISQTGIHRPSGLSVFGQPWTRKGASACRVYTQAWRMPRATETCLSVSTGGASCRCVWWKIMTDNSRITPEPIALTYDEIDRRDKIIAAAAFESGMKHAMEIVLRCRDETPPVEIFRAIQRELANHG